jgi:putative PIN family toxin of toxin-antitoxin system
VTIVFDTNVLFAALTATQGVCAGLVELCLSHHVIVSSEHILGELRRHLATKHRLTAGQVDSAIAAIQGPVTRIVIPAAIPADACRDPGDLAVLGTAVAGGAQVIVTGDKDLLVLKEYRGVLILSPRQFLDRFTGPGDRPIA